MGLLNLFRKSAAGVSALPAGSLTVDRDGCIIASTIASAFPSESLADIAREVVAAFGEAAQAQTPLSDLNIHYKSLKIVAREMRGGAIIFLAPQTPYASAQL